MLSAAIWLWGEALLPFAFDYPKEWRIPAARWIGGFVNWLVKDAAIGPLAFSDVTRFLAALIDYPYQLALGLLADGVTRAEQGNTIQIVPPLSWIAVIGIVALMGLWAEGAGLALLMAGCFLFVAVFGQWHSAMVTLASILVAVPLGMLGGLFLGILAWRHRLVRARAAALSGPDADDSRLCLSGADPDPVRLRADLGGGCHADLRHAADDAHHHAGTLRAFRRNPTTLRAWSAARRASRCGGC